MRNPYEANYTNPFEAENPYGGNLAPESSPENPGGRWDDPIATPGQTQNNIPCAPGYEKKLNAAGTAYECVKSAGSGDCPSGTRPTVIRADGSTGPQECVDEAEYQRRLKIAKDSLPAGAGGGGGSSSSGGSGSTAPFNPKSKPYEFEPWTPPTPTPFAVDLEKQLSDFMSNWSTDVPYTDPVVSNMKTNAFLATKGRTPAELRSIKADAIRRGVLRSTGTDQRIDAKTNAANAAYAGAERGIENSATMGNFEARTQNRLAALDRAQRHVDSEREYLMASEMNHFNRQEGLAKLALAYYSLEQQRWELTQQLNSSKYQFDKSSDWNKTLLEYQILNGIGA